MPIKQILASLPYQDPAGNVLASGSLTLDLSQPAVATGSGEVAPLRVIIALAAAGTFVATNLWANDQLQPSGTTYRVRAFNSNGLPVADFGDYSITGVSPIDISGIVPSSSSTGTSVTSLTLQTLVLTAAAPTVAAAQVGFGSTTSLTVGAAGAASALPATPTGYLVINVAGTAVKIPYYTS